MILRSKHASTRVANLLLILSKHSPPDRLSEARIGKPMVHATRCSKTQTMVAGSEAMHMQRYTRLKSR